MADFDLLTTDVSTGLSVIEASAGTGKTWTISHLVPRLLVDGVIGGIGDVLLVTFTEDAARELGERTRRQLATLVGHASAGTRPAADHGPGIRGLLDRLGALPAAQRSAATLRLRLALDESDQLAVSTIHAFCKQVLEAEGFLCGMPAGFEVLANPGDARSDAVKDTWRADLAADSLLASVVACGGGSVEEDLKAWRSLTRRPSTRMDPEPLSLRDARGRVARALEALREARADIRRLQEIAGRDSVKLNNSAGSPGADSVAQLDAWYTKLETLDRQPPVEIFRLAGRLAAAKCWFGRRSALGRAASDEADTLPIVAAAGAVEAGLAATGWAWLAHLRQAAGRRYAHSLRRSNAVTYDGLIEHLHRALCVEPNRAALARRLSDKWKVGLIDESQDTDQQQLDIFRAIFDRGTGPGRLILVGDPKQAIYSFRGGDLDAYLSARPADASRTSSLATTYRSAPGLVTALNTLFGRPRAFGTSDLHYPLATAARQDDELPLPDDGQGRFVAWVAPGTEDWALAQPRRERAAACTASAIVDLLDRTLGAGPETVDPSHVAVLTRTNLEARVVHEALRARHVPSVVRDDRDVMQSHTASDLSAILKAVLSPTHPGWRAAAMATRLFGYDSAMLAELTPADAEVWLSRFLQWNDLWHHRGIAALMAHLEADSGAALRLARAPAGARHVTDLRHLVELLQAREAESQHSPVSLLQWFEGERMSEGSTADERLHRLEEDGDAVQVVTAHRAKGLEFDFVFCPFLWSVTRDARVTDRLLVRRDNGWVLADGRQRDNRAEHRACTAERLREDVRLAYVALTRGRRRVTLLAGPLGYGRVPTPPSSLDWLLRTDEQVESPEDWYAAVATRKKNPAACEHGDTLRRLHAACPDVMTVSAPPLPTDRAWVAGRAGDTALEARPVPVLDLKAWHLTSFSQLAHGRHEERERRDAVVEPADTGAIGAAAEAMVADVPLAAFASGIHAGNCLHELLEHWDFREDTKGLVDRGLRRYRLHSDEAAAAVRRTLDDLKATRLHSLDAHLESAASDRSLSEWEFLLPLGPAGITSQTLSELFARHARNADERHYAQDLAGLPGQGRVLGGMLTGYIDRMVRANGRWGIVDWKSNYLGPRFADYSRHALWRCAAGQHYLLQVHLYLVALRRYLRLYDSSATAASGSLLFLRGVLAGTSQGVLEITPPEPLLEELDRLFVSPERPGLT